MQAVPINYWAVLVCGVASMVLGSIWFGPLFGKMWQQMTGMDTMDPVKRDEAMKGVWKSYILAFVAALVMAFVLDHSIIFAQSYLKVSGMSAAIQGAVWSWLGFVVPVTLAGVLWESRPWKFWVVNSSYYLIQLAIFALILVSWK
jgi:hypothetical protein